MGKGHAQKRRIKNAVKAKEGNLLKASLGRGSRYLPLPDAPRQQDFEEKLPASLRKLQVLKAVAERGGNKNFKQHTPHLKHRNATKGKAVSEASQHPASANTPNASSTHTKEAPSTTSAPVLKAGQDAPMPYVAPAKTTAKDRKKEYLRLKAKKRKKVHGELLTEKEREMFIKSKEVKFGEQAAAPPTVNLKRKHWDPQGAEKQASSRCKQVFMKQLQEAEKKSLLMAGVDSGINLKKKQKLQEGEREDVRQQLINAYRLKRQKGQSSAATVESLAKLVKKNAEE